MGFGDIHHQKPSAVFILVVQFIKGGNLPPKRWSSVAAENEDHRLVVIQRRKLNASAFVHFEQRKIRHTISGIQMPGTRSQPQSLKGIKKKGNWSGHPHHDAAKLLRRLMHRPPDYCEAYDVHRKQTNPYSEQNLFRSRTRFESRPAQVLGAPKTTTSARIVPSAAVQLPKSD